MEDLIANGQVQIDGYGFSDGYKKVLALVESSNNPLARNPNSTAKGRYQFLDSTGSEFGLDPNKFGTKEYTQKEEEAIEAFTKRNIGSLKATLGRMPKWEEMYLAHQQGAGAAREILNNPGTNIVKVLTDVYGGDEARARDAVVNNAGQLDMTAGEYAEMWFKKFNQKRPNKKTVVAQSEKKETHASAALEKVQNFTDPESDTLDLVEMGLVKLPQPEPEKEMQAYFPGRDIFLGVLRAVEEQAKEDDTILEAFSSGLKESTSGLAIRKGRPDNILDPDESIMNLVAYNIAQEIGDLPTSVAGFIGGSAVGSSVGPVGTVAGGYAGAVGLSEGIRGALIESYNQGGITDFKSFWEVFTTGGKEAAKGALVGGVTGKVGKFTSKAGGKVAGSVGTEVGRQTGEITTMTTVGALLEGQMPSSRDFVVGAISVNAQRGAEILAAKGISESKQTAMNMQRTFVKTGLTPMEQVMLAKKDPTVLEDLIAGNDIPRVLRDQFNDPEQNILKKIKPSQDKAAEEAKKARKPAKIYQKTIDSLAPLKDLDASSSEATIYERMTMQRNIAGSTQRVLKRGTYDYNTKETVGKSFNEIIKPVRKDLDRLQAYMVARRSLELGERGKKTGINQADAEKVISKAPKKFQKSAEDLYKFQDDVLTYFRDSGMITKESYDNIVEVNKDYIPFHRIIEADMEGKTVNPLDIANPLRALTEDGSIKDIENPLNTVVKNTESLMTLADRNAAIRDMIDKTVDNGVFTRISNKEKVTLNSKELASQGISIPEDTTLDVFRLGRRDLKNGEIAIMRDGKREIYKINDPDIADALNSMTTDQIKSWIKPLAFIARMKRVGISNTLTFGVFNFIRGELSASINSPDMYIPIYDGLMGLAQMTAGKRNWSKKYSEIYNQWLSEGGGLSTLVDTDNAVMRREIDRILVQTQRNGAGYDAKQALQRSVELAKAPIEILEKMSSYGENAPRFRQFQKSIKAGRDRTKAAFDSAEVATNFSIKGSSDALRNYRVTSAFMGPYVNSIDLMIRRMKNNPGRTIGRSMLLLTAPTIAAHLMLHYELDEDGKLVQQEWYSSLPDYQKKLFWTAQIGDKTVRVPKPYDYGVMFATMAEDLADYMVDKANGDAEAKEMLDEMTGALYENFFPDWSLILPDATIPFVETAVNQDLFRDAPLVSSSKEDLLPREQQRVFTSSLAIKLSEHLSKVPVIGENRISSPISLENFVNEWTGALGTGTFNALSSILESAGAIEKGAKVKPDFTDISQEALSWIGITDKPSEAPVKLIDLPLIRSFFVANPSLAAQPINDYWNYKKKYEKYAKTAATLRRDGNIKEAFDIEQMARDKGYFIDTKATDQAFTKAMDMINKIANAPTSLINTDEKQRLLKPIYGALIKRAEFAAKRIDMANKAYEEATRKDKPDDKIKER